MKNSDNWQLRTIHFQVFDHLQSVGELSSAHHDWRNNRVRDFLDALPAVKNAEQKPVKQHICSDAMAKLLISGASVTPHPVLRVYVNIILWIVYTHIFDKDVDVKSD